MVLAVVAVPGVDFVLTLRNTVADGRGAWSRDSPGHRCRFFCSGHSGFSSLGTLIVQSQPVFVTLKWLGIGYLAFLAAMLLRSAWLGRSEPTEQRAEPGQRTRGLRQGFLCNITNPKMFVFYLSLLPQFVGPGAPVWSWLGHAWMLPLIGTTWLLAAAVREQLLRPVARRLMDITSGLALAGFGARLALQRD